VHEAGRFFKWIKEVLHTVSETVVAKLLIDLTNNPFTVGSFWAYPAYKAVLAYYLQLPRAVPHHAAYL